MTAPAPEAPARLARAVAVIRGSFRDDAEPIAAFAGVLFGRGAGEYLERLGEDQAAAVAAHAFRFLAAAGPMPRARVFNPSFAVDGWEGTGTVLETVMPDRPFIVDTIREYLRGESVNLQILLHPLLAIERAPAAAAVPGDEAPSTVAAGPLRAVRTSEPGAEHESFVHAVLEPLPPERLAALEAGILERLRDVMLVTADFAAMVARTEAVVAELEGYRRDGVLPDDELHEMQDFLRWLARGGCVFLGYRSLTLEHEPEPTLHIDRGSGLGLFRKESRSHYAAATPVAAIPEPFRSRIVGGPPLIMARTTAYSPVHRHVRMDYVGVKRLDASGRIHGEHRFLGLLTSKALAEEAAEIPILRRRLQQILDAEHIVRGSHDHKEIVAIFNSMPKTELFSLSVEALRADIRMIMAIQQTDAVRVSFRPDALERGVAVMVIMPRDKFSGTIRARIQDALAARFGGQVIDYHLALGEGEQARLHFFLAAPRERVLAVRWRELQLEIAGVTRGWDDRLRERLIAAHGAEQGAALAERYVRAFPEAYKAATEIAAAVHDVTQLEALRNGTGSRIDVQNPVGDHEELTAIKLYVRGEQLVLSDIMPILENLGLRVFAEDAVTIPDLDGLPVYLHTFLVKNAAGERIDVRRDAERFTAALTEVRAGAENDPLNRLVLAAGLSWQQVDLLRTYCNYAFQIGAAPSRRALIEALVRHPDTAVLLPRYYDARFAPRGDRTGRVADADTDVEAATVRRAFFASLDAVSNIGEDRMLRALLALVEATVRTNFYEFLAGRRGHVAIKLDASRIDELPRPRPLYEIYVHSPTMEGVHLRAGRIARGGIRFSDRHDDFRSEILGLMKTQTVKNAVIVPVGAKGGFIVKRGGGPEAVGDAYATLIRGMLDLTDTIGGDRIVPPPGIVCYDDPDPYLVVAADKGTATFSDRANAIAAEYGFWLGDAFASGGSHGYDHKKLGITARGAWECVKQHFRTLGGGHDVERDVTTVVGIGDMSGDVFGNGMLLSRTLKLRAAFDHRHIFLDPDPDPARSYAERARLFALPRSSWADYDRAALSAGGTVVARGAKLVTLSPELSAVLGVRSPLDADSLIQAILRMEGDLLFNGGIGTYVKARGETNAEVGDSANASVRANGGELRARVVAEGGNLGFTQQGRIEYALAGGRINTDAIDNSAGVDMSDHEVNLKIALQPLLESGELSMAQRNRLLAELEPDVSALVLAHNRGQARILSRDQLRSERRLIEFRDLMAELESTGLLDRAVEGLPDRESLTARRATVLGLTRPELAVLLAYAKMHCTRALAADPLLDDPYLDRVLFAYFPTALGERFPEAIRRHRLRREIDATTLSNRVVDLLGMTFVTRTARETGADAAAIVRAFIVVDTLTDAGSIAAEAARYGAATEARILDTLVPAVERAIRWLVEVPSAEPLAAVVARFSAGVAGLGDAVTPAVRERRTRRAGDLAAADVPAELLERCLDAEAFLETFDIITVATAADAEPAAAAAAYWRLDEIVDFPWLTAALGGVSAEARWERRAVEMLAADLHHLRRALSRRLLTGAPELDRALAELRARAAAELARVRGLVDELRTAGTIPLAAMMIIVGELRHLEEHAWS